MEFFTHTLPDAEMMCLACILDDATYLQDTLLESHHFSVQAYSDMYVIMLALFQQGKQVEMMAVYDKLGDIDTVTKVTEVATRSSPQMFRHYEGLVIESWKRRQAIKILSEGRQSVDENMDLTGIAAVVTSLQALDSIGAQDATTFADLVDETVEDLEKLDGSMTGLSTGMSDLNAMTDGYQKEDLIIIAARPSVGKTAFALFEAVTAARNQVAVNVFEMEMNGKQLVKRMLMSMAQISGTAMRAPRLRLSQDEWGTFTHQASKLRSLPIDICDKAYITVGDIRSRVRRMGERWPGLPQLVIIDYLQLMPIHETKNKNATQLYGDIAKNLKQMAREFGVPVILLSQLSRNSEQRQNKRPMMSDIRQSGEIEQHADVVLLLHRDDYYDAEAEKKNIIEINVAKQRNGPTGVVEVVYLRDRQMFVNLSKS